MSVLLSSYISLWLALLGVCACLVACIPDMAWQSHELMPGGDYAQAVRASEGTASR